VRTPLNAIINYLEMVLEETLDNRARENLQQSLTASRSLITSINDLLDLTKAEKSDFLLNEENMDLVLVINEVFGRISGGIYP
jgi:signal transduction histidine kinase